ncbi:MAG: hypothetical protein WCI18_02160 [Pseudomonadota bacterium]
MARLNAYNFGNPARSSKNTSSVGVGTVIALTKGTNATDYFMIYFGGKRDE